MQSLANLRHPFVAQPDPSALATLRRWVAERFTHPRTATMNTATAAGQVVNRPTEPEPLWKRGEPGFYQGITWRPNEPFIARCENPDGTWQVQYTDPYWSGATPATLQPHLMRKQPTHPLAANRKYGWHRSTKPSPHPRYAVPAHHAAGHLPASVDLTPEMPAIYDQGDLGSCTGNALAGLFQYLLMKLGKASFVPSRLMLYWGERQIEGNVSTDSGADGDDGMTFLATKGVCPETLWAYDPDKFAVEPPPAAWAAAYHHKIADPVTIADGDLLGLKSCLASEKPVAIGFTAFAQLESAEVAKTGILPMPGKGEQPIGGHEVLVVGYNDVTEMFKARNSWGPGWGQNGYFELPYSYIGNPQLASDFRSAGSAS